MPRLSAAPSRLISPIGLNAAADAAGYSMAGFQETDDLPPVNESKFGLLRFGLVLAPMILALGALLAVAASI